MNENPDRATLAIYEPLLENEFQLLLDGKPIATAKLSEAFTLKPATNRTDLGIRQDPFSLIFKIEQPHEQLDQRIYSVSHENIGTKDMFLVPVGFGEYQAIFN